MDWTSAKTAVGIVLALVISVGLIWARRRLDAVKHYVRASRHIDREEYDQAIAESTQAIHLDPKRADAYCVRGLARYRMRQFDQAVADYDKALELKP
jgi:tetratricopeptide (TPR) repeat protein